MQSRPDREALVKRMHEACDHAVKLHGTDWLRVQASINSFLASLSEGEREEIQAAIIDMGAKPSDRASEPRPH